MELDGKVAQHERWCDILIPPGAKLEIVRFVGGGWGVSLSLCSPPASGWIGRFPHFMAIAWMYREDYDRAGYLVLPRGQSRDRIATLQTILPLLLLVMVTLVPTVWRGSGLLYLAGALFLSLSFLYRGMRFVFHRSGATARRLLIASIFFLPVLLALMMVS